MSQHVKINLADDTTVSSANPLPVSGSLAIPAGAATEVTSAALLVVAEAIQTAIELIDTLGNGTAAAAQRVTIASDSTGQVKLAASEEIVGKVGASDIVVTIAPTLAAEAHSAGDLLFDSTEVANAVRANGSTAIVESITVIDKGDQKAEINLIFANAATDFGAPGGVPDPDDTEALTVLGIVNVASTDYVDLGANSVATVKNIGLLLKAGAATTSVYLAGVAVGTPTPASTSDLQISIGFLRS